MTPYERDPGLVADATMFIVSDVVRVLEGPVAEIAARPHADPQILAAEILYLVGFAAESGAMAAFSGVAVDTERDRSEEIRRGTFLVCRLFDMSVPELPDELIEEARVVIARFREEHGTNQPASSQTLLDKIYDKGSDKEK